MPQTLSELLSQRIEAARDEYVRAVQEQENARVSLRETETKVIRIQRSIEAFQRAFDLEKAREELL